MKTESELCSKCNKPMILTPALHFVEGESCCELWCKDCKESRYIAIITEEQSLKYRAKNILKDIWDEMVNDASDTAKEYLDGHIDAYSRLGLITADEKELWEQRIEKCPAGGPEGHAEDDPCRKWCAYCGDLVCGLCMGTGIVERLNGNCIMAESKCDCRWSGEGE